MELTWIATANLRLPVYEAWRNGIKFASVCFAGGEKPWEIQMHLPGAYITISDSYQIDIAGAKERVQRAVDAWFEQVA